MRPLVLTLFALLMHAGGRAHDPNLASYQVYAEHGRWLMRIDLATSVLQFLPPEVDAEAADFKQAFAQYLRDHITLVIDGHQAVELGYGGIKSGAHATEAIFLLNSFAGDWMTLDAEITCFEANDRQRHLLRVVGPQSTSKAFLDASNDFQTRFEQIAIEVNPHESMCGSSRLSTG